METETQFSMQIKVIAQNWQSTSKDTKSWCMLFNAECFSDEY